MPEKSSSEQKPVGDSASNTTKASDAKSSTKTSAETNKGETTAKAIKAAEVAAKAVDDAELAAKAALAKVASAKAAAEAAAEVEYRAIADEITAKTAKDQSHTFKRQSEEIFRREMHEPEFFLHKKDRFLVPILSQEQQDELTRKAEIPVDNTPKYSPQHVLSPEFGGLSNYESGVTRFLEDEKARLEELKNNPDATTKDLARVKHNITYLESLHENYFLGMNVFRTARGGRNKLKA